MAEAAATIIDQDSQDSSAKNNSERNTTVELEENASVALQKIINGYTPEYNPDSAAADKIGKVYTIQLNEPIPELNSTLAEAFKVNTEEATNIDYYGLVFSNNYPHRKRAAQSLRGLIHPNLTSVEEYQMIRLSRGEHRTVSVMRKPSGKLLSTLINSGTRLHEKQVIEQILTPITDALLHMKEKGISHGRIHPENIYLSDKVVLGECISEPSGYSQPYLFEPVERVLTTPYGKGVCNERSDIYALGMLTYALVFGIEKLEKLSKQQLASALLETGSYNAFTPHLELNESMEDFFRGIFNENKQERWGLEQLAQWLDGKRFNLIHPSMPRESSRAFTIGGKDYFNQRALANAFATHWNTAIKELPQLKLDRWLDMSAHKAEVAEKIERWIPNDSEGRTISNTALSRVIAILDPGGPMRMHEVTTNIDGLGATLCDFFRNNRHKEITIIEKLVQNDMPVFIGDIDPSPKAQDTSHTLWLLSRIKQYLSFQSIGFGIERMVYDLNPSLPCQSASLIRYHITDLESLLGTLDYISKERGIDQSLLDRHLAAFITAKLELTREVRIPELASMKAIAGNKELIVLKLLGQAQEKSKTTHKGLATWVAMRVSENIHVLHNRKLRRQLRKELKQAAETGRIGYVLGILFNPDIANEDTHGYNRAAHIYAVSAEKINGLQRDSHTTMLSKQLGARIAVVSAYLILSVTSYFMLERFMGW